MKTRSFTLAAMTLALGVLAGCGGGGDDDDWDHGGGDTALDRAAGFYEGATSGNRHVSVVVLETGRYYVLYGPAGAPQSTLIEGVIVGDGGAERINGVDTFSSLTLQNDNFTNQTRIQGALAASSELRSYFDANISYVGGGTDAFNSDYRFSYEDNPSLAIVAGSYAGQLAAVDGTEDANISIASDGGMSLATAGGCTASGVIGVHAYGNVYDVALTFSPNCAVAAQTLRGHAKFDPATLSLTAVTTSNDLSQVALVVGTR